MDWITRMNTVLRYIEENLEEEIDFKEVERLAQNSLYHFQRVFSYMASVTLSEYIRQRKLTLAAFDLQSSNEKVIDVAIKYGYDSPTAFTRAFKSMHGLAPSEAKKEGATFHAYPPMSFHMVIRGGTAMKYKIVKKEAFRIVGANIQTTMENEQGLKDIPNFWQEMYTNGMTNKICELSTGKPQGLIGVCVGEWGAKMEYEYYIAAASDKKPIEGTKEYIVPASTWAIFECTGPMPTAIQELQKRIISEWLPSSGYDYGNAPDIEEYSLGDMNKEDFKSYIWLPIIEK